MLILPSALYTTLNLCTKARESQRWWVLVVLISQKKKTIHLSDSFCTAQGNAYLAQQSVTSSLICVILYLKCQNKQTFAKCKAYKYVFILYLQKGDHYSTILLLGHSWCGVINATYLTPMDKKMVICV